MTKFNNLQALKRDLLAIAADVVARQDFEHSATAARIAALGLTREQAEFVQDDLVREFTHRAR